MFLEIICICDSNCARSMFVKENFTFRDKYGGVHYADFVLAGEEYTNQASVEERERILLETKESLASCLEEIDFEFISHIKTVLNEANACYSEAFEQRMGYSPFSFSRIRKDDYPAIAFPISEYDFGCNYNFASELSLAYAPILDDNKNYYLQIFSIIETLEYYIEMTTRYKVFFVLTCGFLKLYNFPVDKNGTSIRSVIQRNYGQQTVDLIKACTDAMLSNG